VNEDAVIKIRDRKYQCLEFLCLNKIILRANIVANNPSVKLATYQRVKVGENAKRVISIEPIKKLDSFTEIYEVIRKSNKRETMGIINIPGIPKK
jgi:hypothetical protein